MAERHEGGRPGPRVSGGDAEAWLRAILESLHDGIVVQDARGVILDSNAAAQRILGLTPDEMAGRTSTHPMWRTVHEDGSPFPGETHPAMMTLATGEPQRDVLMGVHKPDGSLTWIVINSSLIETAEGEQVVTSFSDVTEAREVAMRYRLLAENSTDVVYQLDADSTLVWISPSVETVLGWTPDELMGTRTADLTHPDDLARLEQWRAEVMENIGTSTPVNAVELRGRTVTGAYRWMSIQSRPILSSDGTATGTVVGVRDVHEEVLARHEAEASRRRFASMFASHDAMMLLIDPSDGAIVDANRSAVRFYGYTHEELTSMVISDINVLPTSEVAQRWQEAFAGERNAFVFPHRLADGSIRQVEVHSSPTDEPGRMLLFSIVRDVTEDVAARTALVAAEDRYRMLAENATDAVYLASPSGTIEWVSPAVKRLLGWNPDALLGKKSAELVHFEDLPTYRSMVADVEQGREPVTWEFRAKHVDRTYRWMSAVSSPIIDEGGVLTGRITTLRDIDQQVRDRQALARSEQTFRLAMAGAPHEMAVVGLHGPILQANQVLRDLVGREESWLTQHNEAELLHPEDAEADREARDQLLAGDWEFNSHEARLVASDGREIWVQHSLALVRDEHGMPVFYVSQFQDITEARETRSALEHRASHDALTGLINREELDRRVAEHLDRAHGSNAEIALLYCDLDNFKKINDGRGHAAGDAVLKSAAQRIRSVVGAGSVVARLGGDEFVVLLADAPDLVSALAVAEAIREAVAQPITFDDRTLAVTVSVGLVVSDGEAESHRLIRDADQALYRAKRQGRNQVVVFDANYG